ncbi:unnamed protein product [Lymnaea stagnalis]|uniref:Uncharacterized protein n=1 Tax=Lymnaea stagnalis TaxID=6523 RepID=A0AAV2H0S6_LYMST
MWQRKGLTAVTMTIMSAGKNQLFRNTGNLSKVLRGPVSQIHVSSDHRRQPTPGGDSQQGDDDEKEKQSRRYETLKTAGVMVGAGAAAILLVPMGVAALGFGPGGVAAGSVAAAMMSHGGILVYVTPVLQSIGAAGLSGASTIITGVTGAGVGRGAKKVWRLVKGKNKE